VGVTVGRHGGRDGFIRERSAEARAAEALHPVGHSVGLVLVALDSGREPYSFVVGADGEVSAGCGWGQAGPTAFASDLPNPPPNPTAVHTVLVETDGDEVTPEAFVALRGLVEAHNDRYAGCGVWAAPGVDPEVERWVRAGCPEPDLVAVPTDEELAEANVVEQPAPSSPMGRRRDGSSTGFTESQPAGPPVPGNDDRDVRPAHAHS
jgi:hypothetical protein